MKIDRYQLDLIQQLARAGICERLTDDLATEGKENFRYISSLLDFHSEDMPGSQDDRINFKVLYNAIGALYPVIDDGLRSSIRTLANVKFLDIQTLDERAECLGRVCEPSLIHNMSGHTIWPDVEQERSVIKRVVFFNEFQTKYMQSDGIFKPGFFRSDFFMAYTLLYLQEDKSFCNGYAAIAHPEFLERVVATLAYHVVDKALASSSPLEPMDRQVRIAGAIFALKEGLPQRCHKIIDDVV